MISRRYVPVALVLAGVSATAGADTLGEALRSSSFGFDWRLRQETVDQAGFVETADAVTSRFRASVTTGTVGSTSLLAEIVLVEDIVGDYNSTVNGLVAYPVVADPSEFAAVNRFAFVNKSLPKTTLTLGRQRITLEDHRFIGNVGWRQHEQTYDGLRASRAGDLVKVDLTYANQVNRIFGPDSPVGNWHGDIALANFSFTTPVGTLTAFDYHLDLDDAAAVSSNTVGLKLAGSRPVGGLTGIYALTYAVQQDAGANPSNLDAENYAVEGGLKFGKLTASAGYEVLSGDGTTSFQTPLATLHAFQGWADKFLSTPAAGLQDKYLKLAYQTGAVGPFTGLSALAVLHAFDADNGPARYGDELDLSLAARTEHMTFTLKYATYEADDLFTDTDKLWLSMDYAF
jgi:hypothetical protein